VLLLVLRLGQDRPDNPELIRQGGALWLRRAKLAGRTVDVMSGPRTPGSAGSAPGVDYWLTADSTLLRVSAHLGGASAATSIDLDTARYHAVPRSPALPG